MVQPLLFIQRSREIELLFVNGFRVEYSVIAVNLPATIHREQFDIDFQHISQRTYALEYHRSILAVHLLRNNLVRSFETLCTLFIVGRRNGNLKILAENSMVESIDKIDIIGNSLYVARGQSLVHL